LAAKVLLTGRPRIGKTTVIEKVVAGGLPLAGGFSTAEMRQAGRRVGFAVRDLHSGREGVLAHVDRKGTPRVGKYGVDVASFERIGVGALRAAMERDGCIVIDEIGKMELFCQAFRDALGEVIESGRAVLGTIAIHNDPFLSQIRRRPDVTLIQVTTANRDALPQRVADLLAKG
jgi:nucleoside-triphosphatase THEP1